MQKLNWPFFTFFAFKPLICRICHLHQFIFVCTELRPSFKAKAFIQIETCFRTNENIFECDAAAVLSTVTKLAIKSLNKKEVVEFFWLQLKVFSPFKWVTPHLPPGPTPWACLLHLFLDSSMGQRQMAFLTLLTKGWPTWSFTTSSQCHLAYYF